MIKGREININLGIVNNSSLPQPINILGITTPSYSTNTLHNLFEYNLSTETFVGATTVSMRYFIIPSITATNVSAPLQSLTIQGVADALNTLNIGLFLVSGNVLYASSDTLEYDRITIA